jgi:hypothetical protein
VVSICWMLPDSDGFSHALNGVAKSGLAIGPKTRDAAPTTSRRWGILCAHCGPLCDPEGYFVTLRDA